MEMVDRDYDEINAGKKYADGREIFRSNYIVLLLRRPRFQLFNTEEVKPW